MPPEAPTFVPEEEQLIVPQGTDFSARARGLERMNVEAELDENASLDEDFVEMLKLFGTDAARENFLEACRKYTENYALPTATFEEEFKTVRSAIARTKKMQEEQSRYHNQLMEIMRKLITAYPAHSKEWRLLEKFQNRDVVESVVVRGNWRDLLHEATPAARVRKGRSRERAAAA